MPIVYDEMGNVIYGTSASEASTAKKYATADIVQSGNAPEPAPNAGAGRGFINPEFVRAANLNIPEGAEPVIPGPPQIQFLDVNGNSVQEDMRVRILVPPKYISGLVEGPNNALRKIGGILFPYTPSISYEVKADYSTQAPMHSNFPINFYQRSSVGNISISGKFSVETADDADMYISITHLLKALTRMRSGGESGDADSGAPPPVCRLFAHGEMMLNNVPVAIASYRIELPDSVDYFTLPANDAFGTTSVPVMSTISITCVPMYSRSEMQQFSVTGYLNDNKSYRKRGFI